MPEVMLADATRLTIEPPDHTHEVTDELVDRRLDDLREPMAEITPLEREVRTGDVAVLRGTFTGETREAKVRFPDSYSNPELAGKDATIRVTVRGVKEKVLTPLDDALGKSMTGGKQETVDGYRQSVREELEESAKAVEKMDREQAVVKALVD